MTKEQEEKVKARLEVGVSAGVVIAILLAGASFFYRLGQADQRITAVATAQDVVTRASAAHVSREEFQRLERAVTPVAERLARLEQQNVSIMASLEELKRDTRN